MDDLQDEPTRDTGKYYASKNKNTGAVSGKINIKDKVAKELGWKSCAQVKIEIIERKGKRGLWIELF